MIEKEPYLLKFLFSASFLTILSLGTLLQANLIAHEAPSFHTLPDGTKVIQDKDGSLIQIKPDGSKFIKKADGSSVEVKPDGSKLIYDSDGTSIEVKADGTKLIKKLDGSVMEIKPDGTLK